MRAHRVRASRKIVPCRSLRPFKCRLESHSVGKIHVVYHTSFPHTMCRKVKPIPLPPPSPRARAINTFMTGQIAVARDPRKSWRFYVQRPPRTIRNKCEHKYVHSLIVPKIVHAMRTHILQYIIKITRTRQTIT